MCMTIFKILDVKEFMTKLFRTEAFDRILLVGFDVLGETEIRIDGVRNKNRIPEEGAVSTYITWGEIKEKISFLIKCDLPPERIKAIFRLSHEGTEKVVRKLGITDADVSSYGLFFTIRFENGELTILTGSSSDDFLTGKQLDGLWEEDLMKFLKYYEIGIQIL